jgi:predicted DNA-binding transcriptional regulator AlpA
MQSKANVFHRLAVVAKRYSISRTTLWRYVEQGRLPEPTRLSPQVVGYFEDQLVAFEAKARGDK